MGGDIRVGARAASAAEEKALGLLLRLLTLKEREQFARDGYLLVKAGRWPHVAPFGAQFEIHPSRNPHTSPLVKRRKRMTCRACISLSRWSLPQPDEIVAYYLAMKARYRAFQFTANWYIDHY